jgi:hypothetical protein
MITINYGNVNKGGLRKMGRKSGTNWILIGVVLVAVLIVTGIIEIPQINLPFATQGPVTGKMVDVNKPIDFALTDTYGGSALGSKTLLVYDSDGATQLESLTTASDGTITTSFVYPSGKRIFVYYESSNDKQWFDITVPKMNEKDAEADANNHVALKSFTIGTYSSDSLKFGATTIADAGSYNITTSGTTQTFTYSLANTGNDNTGLINSYDPIYACHFKPVVYMTLSGTNYETVIVYGFDYDFTLGTTHYVAKVLDDYALTKHKVGNVYKSYGTVDISFTLDLTGYSGDSATMQFYVYAYSDPNWCMNHGGNYGVEKVELAEHTVSLVD